LRSPGTEKQYQEGEVSPVLTRHSMFS
jgi:hypothetical protein